MLNLSHTPQILFFDADDTLWQNNIYFERAIASFISFLDHRVHSPAEVREHLNARERVTIAEHGYGVKSFTRSLLGCFADLSSEPITAVVEARIEAFAASIAGQELELLPDVERTLAQLAQRHRLVLVTKGDPEEQTGKLERSGLRAFFTAVEVPAEKDAALYRELALRHACPPERTWMIGNSPRSDINPALAAGLHAVYIPHASTWALEREPVEAAQAGRTLLQLAGFADLLRHF